jgi:hypothetical protein
VTLDYEVVTRKYSAGRRWRQRSGRDRVVERWRKFTFKFRGGKMSLTVRNPLAVLLTAMLVWLSLPASLLADDHAVTTADLHQALVESARTRQTNVETVQKFFSSEVVKKTLSRRMMSFSKVEKAIPLLSDEELNRLASQCRQVESDIAAGALTNQEITYILIALATAVVILVIIAA